MLTKYTDSVFAPFATNYEIFDNGLITRFIDDLYARDRKYQFMYEVEEKDNCLVFTMDLPGVKPSDLKVIAEGRNINLSGKQKGKEFSYTYSLHKNYEPSGAKAKLEDGVLTIKFDKRETEKKKTIEIQIT